MRRSKIGWCDYSGGDLNFVIGCTPISEGCKNCYAAAWAKRCGRDFSNVRVYSDKLDRLRKAKWDAGDRPYRRGPGSTPIMFPVDLGDLFHPAVPDTIILTALDIFWARDDADWVLLTKRPYRMLEITGYWLHLYGMERLPPNIWCMVTAENQRCANERVPILLQIKAAVRGVSVEPMLGPVDIHPYTTHHFTDKPELTYQGVEWVIAGAESGPKRRPFEVAWAEDIYRQCWEADVAFFGKQDSGPRPGVPLLIEGCEVKEWPNLDTKAVS